MSEPDLQPATDVINDLAFLHHVAHLNAHDHAFAEQGGQITYFIDTNILRFALDPSQSASEGRFPLALFEHGADPAQLALMPAAFEVAEYLFSGKLPGQVRDSVSAFVSDSHAVEIERFEADLYSYGQMTDADALSALQREYGEELADKARRGFTEIEILDLAVSATHLVEEMFAGSLHLLAAAKRLRKRWVSGRAHRHYAHAHSEVQADEIEEWSARVACGYEAVRFRSLDLERFRLAAIRPWRRQLVKNDARTLLEVRRLNALADPKSKVVFITSSRGLHRAYRDWFIASGPKAQAQDTYLLRHPLQYLPLINLQSYSRLYLEDSPDPARLQLFADIKASLDAFLDPREGRPSFGRVLSMLHRLDSRGHWHHHQDLDQITAQIEWRDVEEAAVEFVDNWRLAYANSALMALPALRTRYDDHLSILTNAVRSAGGNHMAAQQIIVANIEADHISALLWALGQEAAREHGELPAALRDLDVVRVLPILIPIDSQDRNDPDIVQALRGSVTEAAEIVRKFTVNDAAQDLSPNRLLAGVCLSLALAEYDTAKRLSARWAKGDIRPLPSLSIDAHRDDVLSEFRYLYGLAVRFDCRSNDEFQAAINQLSASAEGADPSLRKARSLVEKGTLKLAASLRSLARERLGTSEVWPHLEGDVGSGTPHRMLKEACADFYNAKVHLAAGKGHPDVRERLQFQAAANILCCFNLAHIAGAQIAQIHTLASWAYPIAAQSDAHKSLKWISTLNIDAYETIQGRGGLFPGRRSAPFVDIYTKAERLKPISLTRRFIAGSDRDLVGLYREYFAEKASA
ncbi:MAG: hypothetical protein LCH78_19895 [Proteobacteria bacterium]|jgi:hypothetical protein|nr:hypothetical protein [Pseudomonadota bacterium]